MLFREDKVARADAEAIRKGVGFYRWTHDLVEITGKDALEVLQKIYISDISKVAVGRSKYTASLDEAGEIIDDVIVMHMADGLYWVSDLYGPRLLPWIEQHKGEVDIHAKIITYDWDMYAVQGPDSLKAMNAMLDDYGNPSSTHAKGRAALKLVMNARKQLAKALGCEPWEIAFTSCGSESDNWALWSGAEYVSRKGGHIISSTVEHDAIRRALDELERRV